MDMHFWNPSIENKHIGYTLQRLNRSFSVTASNKNLRGLL